VGRPTDDWDVPHAYRHPCMQAPFGTTTTGLRTERKRPVTTSKQPHTMTAGKWNTQHNVRARCQERARSRADTEAATPKHKAQRATRHVRKTAERRADCARRYARDCDARTDTRIARDDAARTARAYKVPPPRCAAPRARTTPLELYVNDFGGKGGFLEDYESSYDGGIDIESDPESDDDDDDRRRCIGARWRLEELVEDTGLTEHGMTARQALYGKDLPPNLPTTCENDWRKQAALAVIQYRFNSEGRPLDEDGEELTVRGPSSGTCQDPRWVPSAFRRGRVIDNFHPSHLGLGERMNLFDLQHGMISAAVREHQRAKGELPTFQMKWSGHLECGEIHVMNQGWWRYSQTVDWGWITYDNWATAQRWYVPSSGHCVREVFLEARPRECAPSPCTWRRVPHPIWGLFDEFGNELPEFTYHRDQYQGPQHHMSLGFNSDLWRFGFVRKYAWQLPFGPLRKVFDEWCDESQDYIAQFRANHEAGRLMGFVHSVQDELSVADRAFLYNGGCGSRNPALKPVFDAVWDQYRLNEFIAPEGWKIANLFYKHRSHWRTTVASWMKKRVVVLYWQEKTQQRLCAPGGAGRAADEAEFAAEFEEEEEWSEC